MIQIKECPICKENFEYKLKGKQTAKYCSRRCQHKGLTLQRVNLFYETASEEEKLQRLRKNYEQHVVRKKDCWEWKGYKSKGYGRIRGFEKNLGAHRASWILHKGQIPAGMLICHKCDNPECTNPDHLFLGSYKDNSLDRDKKGRHRVPFGDSHPFSKLSKEHVQEIKKSLKIGIPGSVLARKYNVHDMTISDIKHGKTWQHIGKQ